MRGKLIDVLSEATQQQMDSESRRKKHQKNMERKAQKDARNPYSMERTKADDKKQRDMEAAVRRSHKSPEEARKDLGIKHDPPKRTKVEVTRSKNKPENVAHRVKPGMDKIPLRKAQTTVKHTKDGQTSDKKVVAPVEQKDITRGTKTGKGDRLKTKVTTTGGAVKIPKNKFNEPPTKRAKNIVRVPLKDSDESINYGSLASMIIEMGRKSAMSQKRGTMTGAEKEALAKTKHPLTPGKHEEIQRGEGEVTQTHKSSKTDINLPNSPGIRPASKKSTRTGRKARWSKEKKELAKQRKANEEARKSKSMLPSKPLTTGSNDKHTAEQDIAKKKELSKKAGEGIRKRFLDQAKKS